MVLHRNRTESDEIAVFRRSHYNQEYVACQLSFDFQKPFRGRSIDLTEKGALHSDEIPARFLPDTLVTKNGHLSLGKVTVFLRDLTLTSSDGLPLQAFFAFDFQLSPNPEVIEAMLQNGVMPGLGATIAHRAAAIATHEVGRHRQREAIAEQEHLEDVVIRKLRLSVEGKPQAGIDGARGQLGIIIDGGSFTVTRPEVSLQGEIGGEVVNDLGNELRRTFYAFEEIAAGGNHDVALKLLSEFLHLAKINAMAGGNNSLLVMPTPEAAGGLDGSQLISSRMETLMAQSPQRGEPLQRTLPPPTKKLLN